MDPTTNPYAPGAGSRPPELAGRDQLIAAAAVATTRIRNGLSAKSLLMIGLRGVGKTVLLDRMRNDAAKIGLHTIRVEAPEAKSLPAILAPELRVALLRLSNVAAARQAATRALRALAGFVKSLRVKFGDISVSIEQPPEPGLADNGDLEHDLMTLLDVAAIAAESAGSALVIFVDELQYVAESQLEALITALHRCAQQSRAVTLIGAGLPQLPGKMGAAKSYAERLFDFPTVGPLDDDSARVALEKPASDLGVEFEPSALDQIIHQTKGYPYFLQEWGKHVWDTAAESPIRLVDVKAATIAALHALDESFFRVRFDRMTPSEKRYLRAMSELGSGPHRSGDIADQLDRRVQSLGPTRAKLISKGMIWSPSHGDTAFTVPLFDEFMRRILPGDEWRTV